MKSVVAPTPSNDAPVKARNVVLVGAKTIEAQASHVSIISHPQVITRLIFEAAGHEAGPTRLWAASEGLPQTGTPTTK
jgi:hypothetical protein